MAQFLSMEPEQTAERTTPQTHHHHHHGHGGHSHLHGHHHGTTTDSIKNIRTAFFINLSFTIIELIGGLLTNSVAIMSDALHDLGDSLSLGFAWYFQKISGKKRDRFFSYGYRRFSLLGAVINSLVLLVGSVFILSEAIPRLLNPQQPNAMGMMLFAFIGIAANGFAAYRLSKGSSLNERAVMLHLIEDVLGWVAVLIGSIVIMFTDLPIIDPILSILITLFILFNVFKNLKAGLKIFLQAIPDQINTGLISKKILAFPGAKAVHDLHLWSLDGSYHVLTLHLVVDKLITLENAEILKQKIRELLYGEHIQHVTIELELEGSNCDFRDC